MEKDKKNSPLKTAAAVAMNPAVTSALITAGGSVLSGLFGSRRRKRQQREAQRRYDEQKAAYEQLDTSNLYADYQNQFTGLENTMEDLTVNQQQAQFQAQQGAQARADMFQSLRGAAGASGVAGLAQAMANQQIQQTQQISASIGQQEAMNQRLAAQQAARIQQMEAMGEDRAQQMRMAGEEKARALEYQKTSTMFGMGQQRLAAANQAVAQGQAQLASGIGGLAAAYAGGAFGDINFGGGGSFTTSGKGLDFMDYNSMSFIDERFK